MGWQTCKGGSSHQGQGANSLTLRHHRHQDHVDLRRPCQRLNAPSQLVHLPLSGLPVPSSPPLTHLANGRLHKEEHFAKAREIFQVGAWTMDYINILTAASLSISTLSLLLPSCRSSCEEKQSTNKNNQQQQQQTKVNKFNQQK